MAGEAFPTPNTDEIVVFTAFFYRGFALPTCGFFRGLLDFYRIELVHLNPNSVLHIAAYIHLCEAYLGIRPHFNLFRFLFVLKAYKNKVVGGAGLQLRGGRSQRYINLPLKTSLKGWHEEWFYVTNPSPSLPPYDGHVPIARES